MPTVSKVFYLGPDSDTLTVHSTDASVTVEHSWDNGSDIKQAHNMQLSPVEALTLAQVLLEYATPVLKAQLPRE